MGTRQLILGIRAPAGENSRGRFIAKQTWTTLGQMWTIGHPDVQDLVPMPWLTDADSLRHNRLAQGKLGEVWRKVANETLERTGDEGSAIREANAVINRIQEKWSDPFG